MSCQHSHTQRILLLNTPQKHHNSNTWPPLQWPGDDALEPHQLQEIAATRSNGRIALVAVDATWGCAVKMRRRYPEGKPPADSP